MTISETAQEAAEAAGKILADYFHNGVTMRTKSASVDLVSDADVNAERCIADKIRAAFPDHHILGEEENSADVDAEHLWIIDPLDGTTNFAHGIPHFAVSIGYYHEGVAQHGVIHNPIRNDWFRAERAAGAFHNDQLISVSQADSLNEVLVGVGFYYDRGEIMSATLAAVERLFRQQIHLGCMTSSSSPIVMSSPKIAFSSLGTPRTSPRRAGHEDQAQPLRQLQRRRRPAPLLLRQQLARRRCPPPRRLRR